GDAGATQADFEVRNPQRDGGAAHAGALRAVDTRAGARADAASRRARAIEALVVQRRKLPLLRPGLGTRRVQARAQLHAGPPRAAARKRVGQARSRRLSLFLLIWLRVGIFLQTNPYPPTP